MPRAEKQVIAGAYGMGLIRRSTAHGQAVPEEVWAPSQRKNIATHQIGRGNGLQSQADLGLGRRA